jgi:DDE domain
MRYRLGKIRPRAAHPTDQLPGSCLLGVSWVPLPAGCDRACGALVSRFGLSYRDMEELLAVRGITVDHVTVHRWVQRFSPLLVDAARFGRHRVGNRWHVDETYVKVAGRWVYLYRGSTSSDRSSTSTRLPAGIARQRAPRTRRRTNRPALRPHQRLRSTSLACLLPQELREVVGIRCPVIEGVRRLVLPGGNHERFTLAHWPDVELHESKLELCPRPHQARQCARGQS